MTTKGAVKFKEEYSECSACFTYVYVHVGRWGEDKQKAKVHMIKGFQNL